MKKFYVLIFILFLVYSLSGQVKNLRSKFFIKVKDSVIIDSLSIVPNSVKVFVKGQVFFDYKLYWQKSIIVFPKPLDSVLIVYRVFSFNFYVDTGQEKPLILPFYSDLEPIPNFVLDNQTQDNQLNTEGRISRGIFFGSNQQPSLTSDLNLSVSGRLDNNILFEANMSDNMLNDNDISGTYNLQDFDKTMIKITFPKAILKFGDLQVKNNLGYFVKFNRAVKGSDYQTKTDSLQWRLGFGVQKGIFVRQQLQGEEGNQGPYRLIGKSGEQTILIVSGSERVYIDGILKKRGISYDYTIDYNSAEITFTANCLITRDSRIIVEFEYWITDYQRYSLWTEFYKKYRNSAFYYGFVQVKDNLSSQVNNLNNEQIQVLYNAGDSVSKAIIYSADSVGFKPDQILYCKRDTIVDGQVLSIFEYCQEQQAVWKVNFSYVGIGQGDYVLDKTVENGRIFRWVGIGQGDFMPIVKLNLPQRKTVLYGSGSWVNKNSGLSYELAVSNFDRNLFSPFDDQDNQTYNLLLRLGHKVFDNKQVAKDSIFLVYRFVNMNFAQFNPFLPTEFARDWNINFEQWKVSHYLMLGNRFISANGLEEEFNTELLFYPQIYKGFRFNNDLHYDSLGWVINSWVSYNYTQQEGLTTSFFRTQQRFSRNITKAKLGLELEAEYNVFLKDSLLPNSYAYLDYKIFFVKGDSNANLITINGGQRYYQGYFNAKLKTLSSATELNAKMQWKRRSFSGKSILNFRYLQDNDTGKTTILSQNNILWRIWNLGNLSSLTEFGQGLQRLTEFFFIRVPTGQGQYAWIDFNNDQRQQLNEFQLTDFTEQANYIRVILPGLNYIPVFVRRQEFTWMFKPNFSGESLINRFLNRLSNQFSLRLIAKNKQFNILYLDYTDSNMVFFQYTIIDNFILKLSKKLLLNFTFNNGINKDLLLGGIRQTKNTKQQFLFRYNLDNWAVLSSFFFKQNSLSQSQLFLSENYTIATEGLGLSFSLSQTKLQIEAKTKINFSRELQTEVFFRSLQSELMLSYILFENLRMNINAKLINNVLSENINEQLSYVFMRGYSIGWNFSNIMNINYRISKSFIFQFDYQLRIITSRAIHNFGFKLTGLF